MYTTRQLVVTAASLTFALALPWAGGPAYAGDEETPLHALIGPELTVVEVQVGPEEEPEDQPAAEPQQQPEAQQPAAPHNTDHLLADPKPLSEHVKKGLEWLASQQLDNGGWGQGEESQQMRQNANAQNPLAIQANVGDTCTAALALIRSGSTPASGAYDGNIRKAVEYVCASIEKADTESLYITETRNTRLQAKLGTYVDTFLAAQLLGQVTNKMASTEANDRVKTCLEKVVGKIESHQDENGQFKGQGWALALNDALANKALNVAAQNGVAVDPVALEASRRNAEELSAPADADGKFGAGGRAAGVELYGAANSVGGQRETDTTYRQKIEQQREEVRRLLEETADQAGEDADGQAVKEQAETALRQLDNAGKDIEESEALAEAVTVIAGILQRSDDFAFDEDDIDDLNTFALSNAGWADNRGNLQIAQNAIVNRLGDERFVAGFGNNGGEEFLSYTRIGESLYLEGGQAWETFDEKMTTNLTQVQNKDGSWSGHHCITGRTFCTSAALSVLMTDRMQIPEELLKAAEPGEAEVEVEVEIEIEIEIEVEVEVEVEVEENKDAAAAVETP